MNEIKEFELSHRYNWIEKSNVICVNIPIDIEEPDTLSFSTRIYNFLKVQIPSWTDDVYKKTSDDKSVVLTSRERNDYLDNLDMKFLFLFYDLDDEPIDFMEFEYRTDKKHLKNIQLQIQSLYGELYEQFRKSHIRRKKTMQRLEEFREGT